ncbi:MAG: hypothetical protein JRE64_01485 [Deltaproteobacteria bacterium]|nr:hypothetical protein [Deltaproteobacteria bacterium]
MAISLLLGEIIVRIVSPQKLSLNVTQWDPYVGFLNIPNIEGFSRTQDFIMHVKINSRGLRDREFELSKPSGTFRIGVFGDSFTFGEGVQNEEAYPKILEKILKRDTRLIQSRTNVEVINFGLGKTGTSQQLALYQQEGTKYDLDCVILGFLSGNDFTDNWGGVFSLRDDKLIHNAANYSFVRRIQRILYRIPFYGWLATHSHLVNLFRKAATLYDDSARMRRAAMAQGGIGKKNSEEEYLMSYLTLRLIKEFQREVLQNGSSFLIVNLPEKDQKNISDYVGGEAIPQYVVRCEALKFSLIDKNIRVLDLIPVFSSLSKSHYYFEHDGHMTKCGHQVIASNVYEFVLPEILSRESQVHSYLESDVNHTGGTLQRQETRKNGTFWPLGEGYHIGMNH